MSDKPKPPPLPTPVATFSIDHKGNVTCIQRSGQVSPETVKAVARRNKWKAPPK